jgi:hypothetical protein
VIGLVSAAAISITNGFLMGAPSAILEVLGNYGETEKCGIKCSDYFTELTEDKGLIQVFGYKNTDHLILVGTSKSSKAVEISVPSSKYPMKTNNYSGKGVVL